LRIKIIQEIALKNNIALIYLFGSKVETGMKIIEGIECILNDPLTDIDVGIVFKDNLPDLQERYEIYSSIYNQLEEVLQPYPVDLVFLQETHSVFQGNAICGKCIYYCSLDFKQCYEESILSRAADFRPFLERYLDEVLEVI